MKAAIVHDWLSVYGGAERVLEQMIELFPEADIYSLIDFVPEDQRQFLKGKQVHTTFIQNLPLARTKYRNYLPLFPYAIEQIDLSAYDLVLSSSYAVAKGVITGPNQLHICLCHSPIRYAWDLQHQYLKESNMDSGIKGILVKYLLNRIRMWDYRTANGVDDFIAVSGFIAKRIWKVYRRESHVIYPPVDIDSFNICHVKSDYYLTASRLVPYKKIELIVEAFSHMPDKKLVVIGEGPDYKKIKEIASPNVELLGHQPFAVLREHMQKAKAFVFAAEEDFGIVPIEAQACGTPVLAYGRGGALETIRGLDSRRPSGVFFQEQTSASLIQAVEQFEDRHSVITPDNCRNNAERFSAERFRSEFLAYVNERWRNFNKSEEAAIQTSKESLIV